MSYCRWSSDNYKCDLYCYESTEGFVTHVASKRIATKLPNILGMKHPDWYASYQIYLKAHKEAKYQKIGLKYDGKTFIDSDLQALRERLLELRNLGYNFPDYVLEEIEQEIKENEKT